MFKKYMKSIGPCMHVEIGFNEFLLQNAFIRVKICFNGHIIVRPIICRSLDILSFYLITMQLHLNMGKVSFLVQYVSLMNESNNSVGNSPSDKFLFLIWTALTDFTYH